MVGFSRLSMAMSPACRWRRGIHRAYDSGLEEIMSLSCIRLIVMGSLIRVLARLMPLFRMPLFRIGTALLGPGGQSISAYYG